MNKNLKPIFLLFFLLSIIIFLVGFRYGRKIERLDKSYIPPTPTLIATPSPIASPTPVNYSTKQFKSKLCGISFLIPDNFKTSQKNYQEILSYNQQKIIVNCQPEVEEIFNDYKNTTPSAEYKINRQQIDVYQEKNQVIIFSPNSAINRLIQITTDPKLEQLIIKTIEIN